MKLIEHFVGGKIIPGSLEKKGKVKKLVCPYHAWAYDLSGDLISARMMNDEFEKKDWGLNKCKSKIFEGLIFINLSYDPDHFYDFINPIKNNKRNL